MRKFRKDNKLAYVKRLSKVDDNGFKKSGYEDTGLSYRGHLKFLTLKDGIEVSNFGKEYQFNTNSDADIKEGDQLIIDEVVYNVSGLASQDGISFSRLVCILKKG